MPMPFTEDDMKRIFSTPLAEVARDMGFTLKPFDRKTYHVDGMGGLYIYKPEHGRGWYQFTTQEKGNIIDFVVKFGNMSKLQAMEYILNSKAYSHIDISSKQPESSIIKKSFELPPKADSYKQMMAYLIGTRKIDKDIVYQCIKDKLIYQAEKVLYDGSKVYNCAFVGLDKNNEAKHCHLRATNSFSNFRGDVLGSDKSIGFSLRGNNNTLLVFESAIDALSGASLIKHIYGDNWSNYHFLSQNGVGNIGALNKYLSDYPEIEDVYVCYDNDVAGNEGFRHTCDLLLDKGLAVTYAVSISKDMNDDLKNDLNIFEDLFIHMPLSQNNDIHLINEYDDIVM